MKKNTTSRRSFLQACGVVGIGLSVCGGAPLTAEAARFIAPAGEKLYKTSQTRLLMGTFVSITAVHSSKDLGQEAVGRAFEDMKRRIAVFDRHDGSTPLAVLNDRGRLNDAPAELVGLVNRALRLNDLSSGAFDATVTPLVDLYKKRAAEGRSLELSRKEFEQVMELVDCSAVKVGKRRISLAKSGMGLTLDGVAKGHIVDKASETLTSMGAVNHLINAGGDIRASGERGQGKPWTVAVENPKKNGDYPEVLRVRNCCIATSGGYEVFFDDDKAFNHLVSPETGRSPRVIAGATVTAPSVMEADALSTSVSVMHLDKGLEFIYSLPGRECLMLTSSGAKVRSGGWTSG
jgi:thiamine biosynthesis lipoprotein